MIRAAILTLLLIGGPLAADQIRIDWRNDPTGNFAPVNLTTQPNYVLTFDAGGNPVIAAQSGGTSGITDGDKGDITVSGTGGTWTVDAGAISLAKMANLAQAKLIGRWTASTGVPEAITVGADFLLTAGTLSLAVAPQPLDADLTDLADGTLTGSKVGTGIDGGNITAGTVAEARIDAALARDAEVAAAYQPLNADLTDLADGSLTGSKVGTGISGDNITTGTVAEARIDASIARDSEVTAALDVGTTMASDDTSRGLVRTGLNNSGGVTQWDAVYLNASSQWVLADANGVSTYPCRGIVTATVATGAASAVITRGTIRNDAWTWTPGGNIYLSTTPGGLTQSPPATTGDKIQVIGYALDADTMAVEISSDFGTAP